MTKAKVNSTVKTKAKKTLPSKLSELIVLAVKDCKAVEKDERYELNMSTWHSGRDVGKCYVCMAGAVMAKSLGALPDQFLAPGFFSLRTMRLLNNLDAARCGYMFSRVNYAVAQRANDVIKASYDSKLRRAPWATYLKAARILAKAGL